MLEVTGADGALLKVRLAAGSILFKS
jgi:hypothetical protein